MLIWGRLSLAIAVEIERAGAATIVKLAGRLDGPAAPALDQELVPLVVPGARLVLDMTDLAYVSSAGLRIFLKTSKQAKAVKASLSLFGINDIVQEVFDISGFTAIFAIHGSRDEALAALR